MSCGSIFKLSFIFKPLTKDTDSFVTLILKKQRGRKVTLNQCFKVSKTNNFSLLSLTSPIRDRNKNSHCFTFYFLFLLRIFKLQHIFFLYLQNLSGPVLATQSTQTWPSYCKEGMPFGSQDVVCQRWSMYGPAPHKPNHNFARPGPHSFNKPLVMPAM